MDESGGSFLDNGLIPELTLQLVGTMSFGNEIDPTEEALQSSPVLGEPMPTSQFSPSETLDTQGSSVLSPGGYTPSYSRAPPRISLDAIYAERDYRLRCRSLLWERLRTRDPQSDPDAEGSRPNVRQDVQRPSYKVSAEPHSSPTSSRMNQVSNS